jgi:hypothetical protein
MGIRVDPVVAVQLMRDNNLEPLEQYPGAAKPWKVECRKCGTKGSPTYAHVKNRGGGCKECGRIRTADAKRLDPITAAELMKKHGYEPLEPFREGKTPWPCIHLKCGLYVTPRYTNIAGGQGGCFACGKIEAANKRRLDGSKCTEELIELGFRPIEEYKSTKARWRCSCNECGHEYSTSLENARKGARPLCAKCNRSRMGKMRRVPSHLAISELNKVGLSPLEDFPGVHSPWYASCNVCGNSTHIQLTSVRMRIAKNSKNPNQGCENCVFKSIGKSRLIDQLEAERRLIELGMRPTGIYMGANEPMAAVCLKCGTENQVLLSKAHSRGRACSTCSLKRRSDIFRKPEDQAVSEMMAAGFRPLVPYTNTNSPWKSIHLECGNEVSPSLSSIKKQSGCSFCAKYGFDSASAAILYVLVNPKYNAIKVGITGTKTTRLERLSKQHGWNVAREFKFDSGSEARSVEKLVLSWWREDLHAPVALRPEDTGALGGWTETAHLAAVSINDTLEFIHGLLS